ncbi:MAG: hypothetical protein KDC84_01910 [Crocinitomicaceae bacterium]|nr:hypothetical protein [Crocinitomicaceae bacterium]
MERFFYILIFVSLVGFGQTDTTHFFDRPQIIDGVYIPEPDPNTNSCFTETKFKEIWQAVQYKKWEEIQSEKIAFEEGYLCPEIAVELYGKELDYMLTKHYSHVTEEERAYIRENTGRIIFELYLMITDRNPIVRAKSTFLLGHEVLQYSGNNVKRKVGFLSEYIELLNKMPHILESGQNYGPNLLDYRSTLWMLIPSVAKYGSKELGLKFINYLKQTYVHADFDAKTIINFAYYFAITGYPKTSETYLKKVQPEISKRYYDGAYDGYLETRMINLLNTHFSPKLLKEKINEYENTFIEGRSRIQYRNKLKVKNTREVLFDYDYDPSIDSTYRLIKFIQGNYIVLFEGNGMGYCNSFIVYKKGKLKCIQYRAPLISNINPPNQFTVWFDKEGMVESVTIHTIDGHTLRADYKGKKASYLLDKKEIKQKKIGFDMLKNYFMQQGFQNWYKYNIPGAYEEIYGL